MKKSFLFFVTIMLLFITVSAQQPSANKTNNFADLGFGFGSHQSSISGSYIHNWKIGEKGKFYIGTGARLTSYFGKNVNFLSSPPSLAKDEKFTDTILAKSPFINALNVLINLGYEITPKLSAGFNIDAIGFSFGNKGNPSFISNGNTVSTSAKPSGFNVLLVGNNDKGSLNSQFYLQYLFGKNLSVKAAYQYLFTELTTDTKVQTQPEANDRFRNKASMGYIGISYKF